MTVAVGLRCLRLAVASNKPGKYHEALWCRANVIRGIAGDEGQLRIVGLPDYAYIFRFDDSFSGDGIGKGAAAAAYLNLVALAQLVDVPEEGIAMSGDDGIACLARLRGLLHVARAFREFSARCALYDDCVHIDLGDHQAREHLLG